MRDARIFGYFNTKYMTVVQTEQRQSKKIHRTLPTSMESSTATNSSFPAKLLLVIQVQYWMHPKKHHSTGTLVHCNCLTIKDFAVWDEMVAVETSIDMGNILWIFYDCLLHNFEDQKYDYSLTSNRSTSLCIIPASMLHTVNQF